MAIEIEVKFLVTDLNALLERLTTLGAQSRGRVFETNIRYEDASDSLIQRKSLLRLRKDQKATLTHKSPVPGDDGRDVKMYNELEVTVGDFETTDAILLSLGFHQAQRYEKWRETFMMDETVICMDTLPFGEFIEIEGEQAAIQATAGRLGLAWQDRILTNYLALFAHLKQTLRLEFNDVTFDNFALLETNTAALHKHLERFTRKFLEADITT